MSEQKTIAVLEITRIIKANRNDVFDALTQPEKMYDWFYGMPEGYAKVTNDLKPGGEYVIEMFGAGDGKKEGCSDYAPHGVYKEIDPPSRLVFTWVSEGFVDHSTVTIDLKDHDEGTELILKHELPESVVEPHTQGWNVCLDHLVEIF